MAVNVKWAPLAAVNADHYNIYRSAAQSGPFVKIGQTPQPALPLPVQIQFLDSTGDIAKWYLIEPVDLDGIPGISTGAFRVSTNAALTQVWDLVVDASNKPVAGLRIEARLSHAAFFNNLIVPQSVSTVTDANGYWQLELYPNSVLAPTDTDYLFLIPGVQPAKRGLVPDGETVVFKDVVGA